MKITSDLKLRESVALHYREEGKYAEAESLYAAAADLTADPTAAAVLWNNAGICALRMYDTDRAVECFRSAVDAATQIPSGDGRRLSKIYAHLTAAYYEGSRMREAWGRHTRP